MSFFQKSSVSEKKKDQMKKFENKLFLQEAADENHCYHVLQILKNSTQTI